MSTLMKKTALYILTALLFAGVFVSCSPDALETNPTTQVSGSSMFDNTTAALVPLNGIYSLMHCHGWSTSGDYTMNFALRADLLAADAMGDDMIIALKGGNWFFRDHTYTMKERWTATSGRSGSAWKEFYTYIANANYIIDAKTTMQGTPSEINYIIGQAYAIRGFSYFMLAQWFSRTYKGHESDPCVPIYTEPSSAGTSGNPRSSVEAVYKVIVADLDTAITRLQASHEKTHISHIDYCTANGFRARVAMEMNDFQKAKECAAIARSKTKIGEADDILKGMNKVDTKNIIWGHIITSDQTDYQRNLFAHMQKEGQHGTRQPKYITPILYNKMGANDIRRKWFEAVADSKVAGGYHYQQVKFLYADIATYMGDYIFMRNEEMLLIEAEAECRLGHDDAAKSLLAELMAKRDPDYKCDKTGTALGKLTNDWTGSLLEEITIQRRIELWAETGRIFDIKRLKQGFVRTADQGFSTNALTTVTGDTSRPDCYMWVMPIPQMEFDGNAALDITKDQNPLSNKD